MMFLKVMLPFSVFSTKHPTHIKNKLHQISVVFCIGSCPVNDRKYPREFLLSSVVFCPVGRDLSLSDLNNLYHMNLCTSVLSGHWKLLWRKT